METQKPKANSKLRGGGRKKISLEDYLDFFSHFPNQLAFTVNYLNQIISMHGFRKLVNVPKATIIDAVNTIDPMNPSRSTLREKISSCASIALEEAIADLIDLNWQECCVTSIQNLKSQKEDFSAYELAPQNSEHPKSKSDSQAIVDANAHGFDGFSTSTCSSAVTTKRGRKRKRGVSKAADHGGGGSGSGDAQSGATESTEWRRASQSDS